MHYSVYRLYGHQKIMIEVTSGLYSRQAAHDAREHNITAAARLGLSLRAFRERNGDGEGWHVSAKSGLAGKKYSEVLKNGRPEEK